MKKINISKGDKGTSVNSTLEFWVDENYILHLKKGFMTLMLSKNQTKDLINFFNKENVAELKKDSIDGKEIGFDSETGGYYFWNKENDVEFDLDSYILIKKSDFEKRLGK